LEYLKLFRGQKRQKAYDFIRLYREIDTRTRLVNTYIKAYLKGSDFADRLHGSFNQQGTVTGRLSSSNPNCQNVATKKGSQDLRKFEEFFGEQSKDEALARQIRRLFIANPGHVLVSIDYSQIEYRLAAYFSCDPVVLKAYQDNPKTDYHQFTADICGITRDQAKTVNFGTLYGMGAKSLASMLDLSYGDAQDVLARIFNARPALRTLIDNMSDTATRDGHIMNPLGRLVRVPPHAPYVALNYLVQGTAGDMMRRAMVRVDRHIQENRLPIQMLLQIHDELLFDMPPEIVHEQSAVVSRIMCRCPEITIPLLCDVEVGVNWGQQVDLKDWDFPKQNRENRVA
jgi:DNA polymerase-1